jgi:hypothetical protein
MDSLKKPNSCTKKPHNIEYSKIGYEIHDSFFKIEY